MKKILTIRLLPSEAAQPEKIMDALALELGKKRSSISGYRLVRRSIDARGRQPRIQLSIEAFVDEPYSQKEPGRFEFPNVSKVSRRVVIIGAGPAGLFAALRLVEAGIKPIILERGKEVRSRRRDLAKLNREGIVNPDSNYCFGEGGAGTYSDGKLYTRSTKRGDVERILQLLVHFGAQEDILINAHPHIGTNKLPLLITAIRELLVEAGAEFHFNSRVTEWNIEKEELRSVKTAGGETFDGDAFILATGHSARDVFTSLGSKILIEFKPFALGVRAEHPQELIDQMQYHQQVRDALLPPASYSLVQEVNGKGVFSFCMCPGGIIAPASTDPGELVVNGWSPSRRNNPFANSGIVVTVEEKDLGKHSRHGALAGMYFQQEVERRAFEAGGGKFVAPAQRLVDFTNGKISSSLPECSYLPGTRSSRLQEVLPAFIHNRLKQAFVEFGKKMKGSGNRSYYTNEAILVATESRTSSPVRIPRDRETLTHPQVKNLYPCGEGAGYAGGIMSAAMDGERIAMLLDEKYQRGKISSRLIQAG